MAKRNKSVTKISNISFEVSTNRYDLTDEYKTMIDVMIGKEECGEATYVSFGHIKARFKK